MLTTNEEENSFLFEELYKAHKFINFTKECKTNDQLALLEVLAEKRHGKFVKKKKVYRKQTFTNNYLKFQSFYSKRKKIVNKSYPCYHYDVTYSSTWNKL